MSKKAERVPLNDVVLAEKIDRIVSIRPMANEYRLLCDEVKKELLARDVTTFTSPAGHVGKIIFKPTFGWLIEKLKKALPRAVYEALCPRKPDAKKLNQRLAATPEDKKFANCRTPMSPKRELEVLAAGQTEAPADVDEDDEFDAA